MEVRIGVVYTSRELVLEMDDDSATVTAAIEAAITGKGPLMWLTDSKGRKVGIPGDKLAYVEVSGDAADRKVGFGR
ncbi:MAG: hypothetical protein QOG50_3226 [Actinomycetota bacterium]|jgi:hypothetical protein|nr:hypothetical protein [Actinomycetota bacterium]